MSYQIKKSRNITETLEILNEDDSPALTIQVSINPGLIAKDFRKIQLELIHVRESGGNDDNSAEKLSAVVNDMFTLIFGAENTAKILDCFEGNFIEASLQITPFITDVVQPAIADYARNTRALAADKCKLSRKQKRRLGL